MYLDKSEINTHLYMDNVEVITRGDFTLIDAAIDAAISEAKGYLSAWDIAAIFGATGEERNALLLTFVKDIAAWHLLNLCNAGSDMKLRQDRYERAIQWLTAVQKGNVSPDLPVVAEGDAGEPISPIIYGSNTKRGQHF
jgi:phage gp36-like protein